MLKVSQSQRKGTVAMRKLINDEAGVIVSAELVLVLTIAVLAMSVGLAAVRDAVVSELCDLSGAFGAIDQSFKVSGIEKPTSDCDHPHGKIAGFGFKDRADTKLCDCQPTVLICDSCGKKDSNGGSTHEDGSE
jgi:hypothetical protein